MPNHEPIAGAQDDLVQVRHPSPSPQALRAVALPTPPPTRPGRPWGFWATAGWTVLLLVVWYTLSSAFTIAALFLLSILGGATASPLPSLFGGKIGALLFFHTVVVGAPVLGLIAALSAARRNVRIGDYLALKRPRPKETFAWIMGLLGLVAAMHSSLHLSGYRPPVDYGLLLYQTSPLPLLVLGVCVAGPIVEEVWWRGFVYRGMAASKAGPVVAVVLTAIPFTLMHTQYPWPELLVVLALGLYLGVVRWQSGSTLLAVFCHGAANLYYIVAAATEVHWLGRTAASL